MECEEYLENFTTQGYIKIVITVRQNCLQFYITATENICKRLPITDNFLKKLQIFGPSAFQLSNRETSFQDISFVAKSPGAFDEDSLKQEWFTLPDHSSAERRDNLSQMKLDNM